MFLPFSERLFGKAWKEEFVVLYEDSSLIWFRDRDRNDPEGGIFLKDAPEMLAAGQVRKHLHPSLGMVQIQFGLFFLKLSKTTILAL